MTRIVSASLGTAVWRAGLAEPYLHWRRTKSAWELAVSWESRRATESGLPIEVHGVLNAHAAFRSPTLLLGIVEHRVQLDTPKTLSQNDLWCMIATEAGQASVAVEAKAGEDFERRRTRKRAAASLPSDEAPGKKPASAATPRAELVP
jgi:hypothetical protein